MKRFRTVLFWMHLIAGSVAGVVILIMSVTGVALTYEKQLLEWSDRTAWSAPSPADATPLPPETLLARVAEAQPGTAPLSLTLRSDRRAPATVTIAGNKSLLIDPYTGAIIGEPPAALRGFFRTMTSWHRYLALDGASRSTGRSITGAANLLFLFIVVSGLYLWLPRVWTSIQFKQVLWFRTGLSAKARDFNWHNVIGIWTAVPLAIVVAGAVPISYAWGGSLVYRLAGETPPPPAGPPQGRGGAEGQPRPAPTSFSLDGLDAAWMTAQAASPSWRTLSTRLSPSSSAPLVVTVDEGYGGQPQKRTTITIDRASGRAIKSENFQSLSPGRQWRSWFRFAHTGEFYGITGQTIAGLASLGGAFLVYTGIALMLRRLIAWLGRRTTVTSREERSRAA